MRKKVSYTKVGLLLVLAFLASAVWLQSLKTVQARNTNKTQSTSHAFHVQSLGNIVALPNMVITDSATLANNNVWITGNYQPPAPICYTHCAPTGIQPFFEHFDGIAWKVIGGPAGEYGSLESLAALASNNIYAVGYTQGPNTTLLVEHWDGTAWTALILPFPAGTVYSQLHAALAFSATNVWIAGEYMNYQSQQHHPLVECWDGVKWNVVTVPGKTLTAIVALKPLNSATHTILATGKDVNNNTVLLQLSNS